MWLGLGKKQPVVVEKWKIGGKIKCMIGLSAWLVRSQKLDGPIELSETGPNPTVARYEVQKPPPLSCGALGRCASGSLRRYTVDWVLARVPWLSDRELCVVHPKGLWVTCWEQCKDSSLCPLSNKAVCQWGEISCKVRFGFLRRKINVLVFWQVAVEQLWMKASSNPIRKRDYARLELEWRTEIPVSAQWHIQIRWTQGKVKILVLFSRLTPVPLLSGWK